MEYRWIIVVMCIQIALLITGVWQIKTGNINIGLFNVIVNSFATGVNLCNLLDR